MFFSPLCVLFVIMHLNCHFLETWLSRSNNFKPLLLCLFTEKSFVGEKIQSDIKCVCAAVNIFIRPLFSSLMQPWLAEKTTQNQRTWPALPSAATSVNFRVGKKVFEACAFRLRQLCQFHVANSGCFFKRLLCSCRPESNELCKGPPQDAQLTQTTTVEHLKQS